MPQAQSPDFWGPTPLVPEKERQESAAIYLLFIAYHILTMDIIYFKIKLAMNNRRLAEENSVIICAPSTSAQDDRGKE